MGRARQTSWSILYKSKYPRNAGDVLLFLYRIVSVYSIPVFEMTASDEDVEKKVPSAVEPASDGSAPAYGDAAAHSAGDLEEGQHKLKRNLKGRHMQMIAIGMDFCLR